MKQIRTWFRPPVVTGERNDQPSLTVPGQEQSIHEIVAKYVRGEPVPALAQVGVYDEDSNFPDVSKMDYLEKLDLKRQLKSYVSAVQNGVAYSKTVRAETPITEDVVQ